MLNSHVQNGSESKSLYKLRAVLTIIFVLINSGYALTTGYTKIVAVLTVLFLFAEWIICGIRINTKNRGTLFLAAFILCILISYIINLDFSSYKEYIRTFILFVLAFHVSNTFSLKDISIAFCRIMRVASITSLILYFIVLCFSSIPIPTITNGYGVRYYTIIIASVNESTAQYIIRNSGLFWEAGMYAAFLFFWQIIEVNIAKGSRQVLWSVVAIIAILTTKSTSGYVYIVFIVLVLLFGNKDKIKVWQMLVFISVIIGGIYLYTNIDNIITLLAQLLPDSFSKLLLNNASVTDRLYNPVADLYVALRNPFGVGLGSVTVAVDQASIDLFSTSLTSRTSTLTFFFAAHGLLCGLMVCIALIRFVITTVPSIYTRIVALFGIIIICTSTPLNSNIIFLLILFYGVQNLKKE